MNILSVREKHSRVLRICHWINVFLLSLMIWSGVLIYWAHQAYGKIPKNVSEMFGISYHLAEGMSWHFLIMWPFTINGIIYFFHVIFNRYDASYNLGQKIVYPGVLFLGFISLASGVAIYKPVQLGFLTQLLGGYEVSRFLHFLSMVGLVLFIFVHIIQVIRSGLNNFKSMVTGYEIEKD